MIEINSAYCVDCIKGLNCLLDNSIDSIVTDPPYEIGFMGKGWDSSGIAYNVEVWKECLRVLKPGGFLLSFGGTRTYHRMACAIEDAGFEIRDQIQWLYGSGFPKSRNIGKDVDKIMGNPREITGQHEAPGYAKENVKQGAQARTTTTFLKYSDEANSEEAKQWNGWGTALKPANEPIVVARKLLSEKTVAKNVLHWGTGGINVDDCRVEVEANDNIHAKNPHTNGGFGHANASIYGDSVGADTYNPNKGRWPANVIHDGSEEVLELFPCSKSTGGSGEKSMGALGKSKYSKFALDIKATHSGGLGDEGSVARFFYCAKSGKKERGEGNTHPTVKPLKLMEYLVRLVTPENGICVDPFCGSGTTLLACQNQGFNFIGFDNDPDSIQITNMRIVDASS